MQFRQNGDASQLKLEPGELHIWSVALDTPFGDFERLRQVLSTNECHRAAGFRFDSDRSTFVVARGLLRFLLAAYTAKQPEELEFTYNPYGKPSLSGNLLPAFNVAHSDGQALYAVCADHQVGVDIERIRPFEDVLKIAREYFAHQEYVQLASAPHHARHELFFRYWTLKEAVVKATGIGLDQFHEFQLKLSENGAAVLEPVTSGRLCDITWHLKWFDPKLGYAGAWAAAGSVSQVIARTCPDIDNFFSLLVRG